METRKIPVIIDTDPGVDDAIAIMIAAASDKINLLGLTPVDGNVPFTHTFENARTLREFLKLDCDVAKGAEQQLEKRCARNSNAHGATGLGRVEFPAATKPFDDRRAWDYIYDKAKEFPGELEIIAIGPLTNIAKTIIEHPDSVKLIKRLLIMGGSTKTEGRIGNVTPYAEFNYWVDPAAAKVVFESGIPIVMAGLNVTEPTGIAFSFLESITGSGSRLCEVMKGFVAGYSDTVLNKEGDRSSVVHDAVPVTYLLDPDACETEDCYIEILTDDEHYGQSVAGYDNPAAFNCKNIVDMDMRRYEALYKNMMEHFEQKLS